MRDDVYAAVDAPSLDIDISYLIISGGLLHGGVLISKPVLDLPYRSVPAGGFPS